MVLKLCKETCIFPWHIGFDIFFSWGFFLVKIFVLVFFFFTFFDVNLTQLNNQWVILSLDYFDNWMVPYTCELFLKQGIALINKGTYIDGFTYSKLEYLWCFHWSFDRSDRYDIFFAFIQINSRMFCNLFGQEWFDCFQKYCYRFQTYYPDYFKFFFHFLED